MYKRTNADRQQPVGETALPPILAQNLFWMAAPAAQQSASAMAGAGRMATEWLSFVHRRLGEDARLAGQLAVSRSPVEFWGRYADFLQKAARDYWEEYAALAKLSGEMVHASSQDNRNPTEAPQSDAAQVARAA